MVDPFQDPPGRSGISPVILGGIAAAAIALAAGAWFVMKSPSAGGPTSTVAIVGENINCRAEPNGNANVLRQVSGYAEFESKKAEGDWVQIGTGDQACWANATYVVLDADLTAGSGEQPRLVEYLKRPPTSNRLATLPTSPAAVLPNREVQVTDHSITGIWGMDVNECSGSDTALAFRSDGEFWGYSLGNARWVDDGENVLVRWGKYDGDELNMPHDAGQAVGAIEWLARDRISIVWQPYGDQNWGTETLIRCP